MYGEYDATTNEGAHGEDHTKPEADIADWKATCGCPVTTFMQKDASHAFMYHRTYQTTNAQAIAWLSTL
jgi:hypothetical protein